MEQMTEEMLDEMVIDTDEQTYGGWTIEDDKQAEWAMMKIKDAEAEVERWSVYYTEQLEKIQAQAKRTREFFTAKLGEYFQHVPHKEAKTQSKYTLPSGDLILKKEKTVWNHPDDDALLEWAKKNNLQDCIKIVEKPSWSAIKARLRETPDGKLADSETGVICEAVTIGMEPERFTVNFK